MCCKEKFAFVEIAKNLENTSSLKSFGRSQTLFSNQHDLLHRFIALNNGFTICDSQKYFSDCHLSLRPTAHQRGTIKHLRKGFYYGNKRSANCSSNKFQFLQS